MNLPVPKVKKQPRVIFFDAAGTLIHLAQPVGWHYARVAQKFGAVTDEARMEAAFRQAWKEMPDRAPSANARIDDDRPWWKMVATNALHRAADVPRDFDEIGWFDALYEVFAAADAWSLYDDVRPALLHLQGRVRMAVISNFDGRLRRILAGLGIADAFEHLIISSEAGSEKPHPKIYQGALDALQVSPGECWHVGDDPRRDWQGAEAVGIHAFHLQRPERGLDRLAAECEEILKA